MWKFQDFSVTQILREQNFGEFRNGKTAAFAILWAMNFVDLINFSLQKLPRFRKFKDRGSRRIKRADF